MNFYGDSYCNITVTSKCIICDGSYDKGFVERIKTIPHLEREWDSEQKQWRVQLKHLDFIKEIEKESYRRVWLYENNITTDLNTGEYINSLFASMEVQS